MKTFLKSNLVHFHKNRLIILLLCVIFIFPSICFADNTYTTDLESGANQYWSITDGNQTGLDITTTHTICFWVKPESLPTSGIVSAIISKWTTVANNRSYSVGLYNDSGIQKIYSMYSNNGTDSTLKLTTDTLSTSAWTHLCFYTDLSLGNTKVYKNGSLLDTHTGHATSIFNSSATFTISDPLLGYFDGLIDQVIITSDEITSTEISN